MEDLPFFAELAAIPGGDGPVHWEVARRVAVWVAAGGRPEPPVDPVDLDRLRALGRVAELQVGEAAPLPSGPAGNPLDVVAVTRSEWALRALDAQLPVLATLAGALAGDTPPDPDHRPAGLAPPVLEGLVFGWMMGQLAQRALGHYDPPLPRPPTSRLSIPSANLDQVAVDWGLAPDEVRLWACLQDLAHHAVLGVPHVREAMGSLLLRYVEGFRVAPDAMAEELEGLDLADPTSFRSALGEPEAVLESVQTPAQADALARLEGLAAAIEGWVGHVVDAIGGRLLAGYPSLQEVVRRRRAEASWGDRYVARLLGIGLRQPAYERGRHFVDGVVERAGEEGLSRLWAAARDLPTPAEIDAPGLWLARIEL